MLLHSISKETSSDAVAVRHARSQQDGSLLLFETLPNLAGVPDVFATLTAREAARIAAAGDHIAFATGDYLFAKATRTAASSSYAKESFAASTSRRMAAK